jgi:hypothetical protein
MSISRRSALVPSLAILLAAGGCDRGLTEINRNPNAAEEVPAHNLLASGIWNTAVSSASAGSHNTWTLLYHASLWPQHVAQPQYNTEDRYGPRYDVMRQVWDNAYASALTDLQGVQEIAGATQPNLWAIAEVMSVYNFLMLTDLFGAVPYSEALKLTEGIQQPKYDPQQEIYPDLLRRLGEAVGRIDVAAGAGAFAAGDLVYGGNMENWRRFANSLRLRIAMRIADTELGTQGRQAFVEAWNAGVITSVAGNAQINWPGTPPAVNDIYRTVVQGGRTEDFRVSKALVDTLQNRNDPRLAVYAKPSAIDGAFRGLPNGMVPSNIQIGGASATTAHFSAIGDRFLTATYPAVFMSYAEVLLLGAEAAARGWIAADPATLYGEGVAASLRQHGISDAEINAYLAQPVVAYSGLESIHLQKWLALFLAGPEAWNEWRRTNVPRLQISFQATEPDIPQRFPYPGEEALYNPNNVPAGVTITTPLWWSARARGIGP